MQHVRPALSSQSHEEVHAVTSVLRRKRTRKWYMIIGDQCKVNKLNTVSMTWLFDHLSALRVPGVYNASPVRCRLTRPIPIYS